MFICNVRVLGASTSGLGVSAHVLGAFIKLLGLIRMVPGAFTSILRALTRIQGTRYLLTMVIRCLVKGTKCLYHGY